MTIQRKAFAIVAIAVVALTAHANEQPKEQTTAREHLSALQPLIGKWTNVRGAIEMPADNAELGLKKGDKIVTYLSNQWVVNDHAIQHTREYRKSTGELLWVGELSLIGWDGVRKQIVSDRRLDEGAVSRRTWEQKAKHVWTLDTRTSMPTGETRSDVQEVTVQKNQLSFLQKTLNGQPRIDAKPATWRRVE